MSKHYDGDAVFHDEPGVTMVKKFDLLVLIHADPNLTAADLRVATQLVWRFNAYIRECFPSIELLATDTGLSTRSVNRAVAKLTDSDGESFWFRLRRGGGRRKSNHYDPRFEAVIEGYEPWG